MGRNPYTVIWKKSRIADEATGQTDKKEENCVGIRDVLDKTFFLAVTTGDFTVTVSASAEEILLSAM